LPVWASRGPWERCSPWISPPRFIDHIEKTCKEADIKNVTGVVCTPDSVRLPPRSVDLSIFLHGS
jgi:hypothetical protein